MAFSVFTEVTVHYKHHLESTIYNNTGAAPQAGLCTNITVFKLIGTAIEKNQVKQKTWDRMKVQNT